MTRRKVEAGATGGGRDPIASFMLEHDVVLRHIARMNRACATLEGRPRETTARAQVHQAIEFLSHEIGIHNRREEEALFSVLDRYVEGPTVAMRAEHRLMKKQFSRVLRSYAALDGDAPVEDAVATLIADCRALAQTMVNHIHKENQILFPLVRKFLTKDALREVARRIAAPEDHA